MHFQTAGSHSKVTFSSRASMIHIKNKIKVVTVDSASWETKPFSIRFFFHNYTHLFIIKYMFKSLTFPGSSLERGTLRKHLFNDRLCRIEFCGGKQREKACEVSKHITKIRLHKQVCSDKDVQLAGMYHLGLVTAPVIEVSSFQWHEIWPTTVSRFYSRSYRSSICV